MNNLSVHAHALELSSHAFYLIVVAHWQRHGIAFEEAY